MRYVTSITSMKRSDIISKHRTTSWCPSRLIFQIGQLSVSLLRGVYMASHPITG